MDKEKVIVLTGSFNPPTRAHLKALVEAMNKTKAVKGYFVPVSFDYVQRKMMKKNENIVIPDDKRMAMLQSMAETDSRIEISDYEISGKGDSTYTYKTICEINRLNPGKDICYLAGADKLRGLSKWNNKEEFLEKYKVIVFDREKADAETLIENDELLRRYKDSFIVLDKISDDSDINEISSTKIRELFRNGNPEYRNYLTEGAAIVMESIKPEDFPELSFENRVRIMKTSPNRHTNQIIFKQVYEENKPIISSYPGIDELVSKATAYKSRIDVFNGPAYDEMSISCINMGIVDAAGMLKKEGYNPAIICSSCRADAAGYYASGDMMSKLSENDLCRRSTLSRYLYQFGNPRKKAVKECGVKLRENVYPLDENFGGIYSPDVYFFRMGLKENFALMDEPFNCSIVSIAPLNFIGRDNPDLKYLKDDNELTPDGREIMRNKIETALKIAIVNGHDSIVIDDFGIKSGHIPQQELAELFHQTLLSPEFYLKFRKVIFAFDEGKRSASYSYKEKSRYSEFYKVW